MAVRPLMAKVSVALSEALRIADAKELYGGMLAVAEEYQLAIVGGDATRWDHPRAIDGAIAAAPYEGIKPVTRSGARPGNNLHITGPPGGSLLGRPGVSLHPIGQVTETGLAMRRANGRVEGAMRRSAA